MAPDVAFIWQRYPGNQAQECRLASAIPTKKANPLTPLDLKINMGKQRHMAISKRDIVEAK
jgi:hypothetical protein